MVFLAVFLFALQSYKPCQDTITFRLNEPICWPINDIFAIIVLKFNVFGPYAEIDKQTDFDATLWFSADYGTARTVDAFVPKF